MKKHRQKSPIEDYTADGLEYQVESIIKCPPCLTNRILSISGIGDQGLNMSLLFPQQPRTTSLDTQ